MTQWLAPERGPIAARRQQPVSGDRGEIAGFDGLWRPAEVTSCYSKRGGLSGQDAVKVRYLDNSEEEWVGLHRFKPQQAETHPEMAEDETLTARNSVQALLGMMRRLEAPSQLSFEPADPATVHGFGSGSPSGSAEHPEHPELIHLDVGQVVQAFCEDDWYPARVEQLCWDTAYAYASVQVLYAGTGVLEWVSLQRLSIKAGSEAEDFVDVRQIKDSAPLYQDSYLGYGEPAGEQADVEGKHSSAREWLQQDPIRFSQPSESLNWLRPRPASDQKGWRDVGKGKAPSSRFEEQLEALQGTWAEKSRMHKRWCVERQLAWKEHQSAGRSHYNLYKGGDGSLCWGSGQYVMDVSFRIGCREAVWRTPAGFVAFTWLRQ